ncbi:CYTH domain-containing protein [Carnobacterium gallinarum]|uniref:CYTH domain-containing protein n=1 Tax=Carnobacterium gallinarum TaxID=2749 RepID=UPI00055363BB|nr:CYTH domain-containing protein [Carnobacterium gallinarum]
MSEQLEIEFKNMLTKAEYIQLLDYFQAHESSFFTQTNSYFDTPTWTLKKLGAGLRIRLLPHSAELTLKTPFQDGLLETTDSLSLHEGQQLIANKTIKLNGAVAEKLVELGVTPQELNLLGTLTTKRFEKETKDGLFVLDESQYEGITDYELEFEVKNHASGKLVFDNFLTTQQLSIRPAKNKIARMIEARYN